MLKASDDSMMQPWSVARASGADVVVRASENQAFKSVIPRA